MLQINRTARTFAEISELYAEETVAPTKRFVSAFTETVDTVKLMATEEATIADMPDALQMQVGVEMLVTTLFDLLRDTRLEPMAERLAWGDRAQLPQGRRAGRHAGRSCRSRAGRSHPRK